MAFGAPVPHESTVPSAEDNVERAASMTSGGSMLSSAEANEALTKREKFARWNAGAKSKAPEEHAWYRVVVFRLITSWAFETLVGLMVMVNLGVAWYETDVTAAPNTVDDAPKWVETLNLALFITYSVEVALRMVALQGVFFNGWINWDTFDLLLVAGDAVLLMMKAVTNVKQNGFVRVLRICRVLRMVKAIRVWPAFRELYVMMHGFFGALKAMLWSTVLLSLLLILFGIIAVEVLNPLVRELDALERFGNCPRCGRAFASVWDSMTTFFQQVVAGDSWGQITIPVMEAYPWTWPIFWSVIVTVQFGILNLILVAIVAQANKASTDDAQFQAMTRKEEFESARRELLAVCRDLDSNNNGEISLKELMVGYETLPSLANQLRFLDVKQSDMAILFSALDSDGSGQVNYEEFVEQLFNMQNQDSGVLLSFIRSYVQEIQRSCQVQARAIAEIQSSQTVMQALILGKGGNMASKLPQVGGDGQAQTHNELEKLKEKIFSQTDRILNDQLQRATLDAVNVLAKYHCQALDQLEECLRAHHAEKADAQVRRIGEVRRKFPNMKVDASFIMSDSPNLRQTALEPSSTINIDIPVSRLGVHLPLDEQLCSDDQAEGPNSSVCECWPSSRRSYDASKE